MSMRNNMESAADPRDIVLNSREPDESNNWLEKYVETENAVVDYFKSVMLASFNVDTSVETILPEYDANVVSGFHSLDELCDLLVTLCEDNTKYQEITDDSSANITLSICGEPEKKKAEQQINNITLKCLSSHRGKELEVKPNRARSHSSVCMDEILRMQELVDLNSCESRRKSRQVSLAMRPKFSNWSKVKGAFKRDKSNTRMDSRDVDYTEISCSGDESIDKNELEALLSNETIDQLSSSEDEFEYYTRAYLAKHDLAFRLDDEHVKDPTIYDRSTSTENMLTKSKSAIMPSQSQKSCDSPNINSLGHRNPFKWYRNKSGATREPNGPSGESLSTPSSPHKNSRFHYDEDSITKIIDDHSGRNSGNEANLTTSGDVLQEVQNKYESLQKRLSREFYEKYHEWRRGREMMMNTEEDGKEAARIDEFKLAPFLVDQSLSPQFKQKFQEWQKIKGHSVSPTRTKPKNENFNPLKKSKSDWHKWRPNNKPESNVLKLFEKDRSDSQRCPVAGGCSYGGSGDNTPSNYSPLSAKKQAAVDILKGKMNYPIEKKELVWLEKELQKVAREKQRLEKEKEKYAERETRLQNMKRAIRSGGKSKQEVLVPTSAGLFRFQGISSKFTRKLYEWEKAKGITAESSTFALLDSLYGDANVQRNNKLHNADNATILSRSRSVGSVEVAGIGDSMLQANFMNPQVSSLSLNDMEHLEETHLHVENDNLMQNSLKKRSKEDKHEFDLVSNESLVIPDYNKSSTPKSIPLLSPSMKSLPDQDCDLQMSCYSKQSNDSGDILVTGDSVSHVMLHPIQVDVNYEHAASLRERRQGTVHVDTNNIIDQLKKLRARTSVDDEDRINNLTNLEQLADQLVDMVHSLKKKNKRNENPDELAIQITDLAITLKQKIKYFTSDELQSKYPSKEGLAAKYRSFSNFSFRPEDTYTDAEENELSTVHCTFTLPSRRVKHSTPSSTESDSYSTTSSKYVDTRRRQRHSTEKHSSGADENYDGSDETTLYLELESSKTKQRRESSDNISTSNSESLINSEITASKVHTPQVLHYLSTLDGAVNDDEAAERKTHVNVNNVGNTAINDLSDNKVEDPLCNSNHDDQPISLGIRSYSPKPLSSKKKCYSCGRMKRIPKYRKSTASNYCLCGKKNNDESNQNVDSKYLKHNKQFNTRNYDEECMNPDSASSTINTKDHASVVGKISRSKVYNFNDLKLENTASSKVTKSDSSHFDKSIINVIVPTTRKIFTPLKQNENGMASAVVSFTIDESLDTNKDVSSSPKRMSTDLVTSACFSDHKDKVISLDSERKTANQHLKGDTLHHKNKKSSFSVHELQANVDKLPPSSPLLARRIFNNDTNSSIKMMIARYNKLTTENPDTRSIDSNCWISSVSKSPVLERRNQFEYITNADANIKKSKSAVLVVKNHEVEPNEENPREMGLHQLNISKSSSVGSLCYDSPQNSPFTKNKTLSKDSSDAGNEVSHRNFKSGNKLIVKPSEIFKSNTAPASVLWTTSSLLQTTLERNTSIDSISSEAKLRNMKLQQAKNRFFNEQISDYQITVQMRPCELSLNVENCNHMLQKQKEEKDDETPVNSDNNSYSSLLNKSVSTSAINERAVGRINNDKMSTSGKNKFGLSSITSRFRKVKMRRCKDSSEGNAVSSLCKASLLINLDRDKDANDQKRYCNSSKSCPSSPVMQRNTSKRNSSLN